MRWIESRSRAAGNPSGPGTRIETLSRSTGQETARACGSGRRKRLPPHHRLRDTFAFKPLQTDVAMHDVATLLGHGSVEVTEWYYAPWNQAQRRRLARIGRELLAGELQLINSSLRGYLGSVNPQVDGIAGVFRNPHAQRNSNDADKVDGRVQRWKAALPLRELVPPLVGVLLYRQARPGPGSSYRPCGRLRLWGGPTSVNGRAYKERLARLRTY